MHWILVYNALFFFDFLFNRIVPNLYISNAGLGTETEKVEKLSPFFFLLLVTRWSYRNSGMMDLHAS